MVGVFVSVVLPIFVMAGLGAVIGHVKSLPAGPISQITLYIFSPCLICFSIAHTTLPQQDLGLITLFGFLLAGLLYVLGIIGAKFSGLGASGQGAFLLAVLFGNSGNYGLPLALFAFGPEGLERAIVFLVSQAILSGTLSIYVASRSKVGPMGALRSVVRMPMVYASIIGLLFNLTNTSMPALIANPMDILGDAAVPSMLMVLGIQLSTQFSLDNFRALLMVSTLRLLAPVGLAFGLTSLLGINGLTQQVLIVLSAMPTAVFTIIIASEFDARPTFVTNAVVLTTLGSLLTVAPLIWLLRT
jgi:predicted permease